ncbi:MAG: ABC transporter permease, partial [Pseudodonghicola sp.]
MAEKSMRGAFPLSTRQISARVGVAPMIAAAVLLIIILTAIFAPFIAPHDPILQSPAMRLKPASAEYLLGTDNFGRDLLSRVIYGARVSLVIGIGVTILAVVLGLAIGLVSGFFRTADAIVMRIMDGLMAMPSVLLAIAIVSLMGASIWTVMAAITIPEIPRVVRLVRSIVLTAREEPYVEAAIALGT